MNTFAYQRYYDRIIFLLFFLFGHRSNEKKTILESPVFPLPAFQGLLLRKNNLKRKKNFVHLKNALFGALGTQDISTIGDESFSNQCHVAASALEAIIVPMAVLKRDESRAANTFEKRKPKSNDIKNQKTRSKKERKKQADKTNR